jgi:NADH-quinone oxidoreductase subunit N
MVVVLFSLTGLPPTAGFIGKLYLFSALIDKQLYWLAVVGVANSVVSLFYYMRVAKAMFFEEGEKIPASGGFGLVQSALLVVLVVPVLIFGIFFGPLIDLAQFASGLF